MLGMPTSPLAAASGEAVEVFAQEIETVRHEGSLALLAYWAQCRAAKGDLVVGEDLPAPAVRQIMSALCLLEPVDEGTDYRFRLAPTGLIRRFGRDVTGCRLSALYDASAFEEYVRGLQRVIEFDMPVKWEVRVRRGGCEIMHLERLGVPVLSNDTASKWILGATFFF